MKSLGEGGEGERGIGGEFCVADGCLGGGNLWLIATKGLRGGGVESCTGPGGRRNFENRSCSCVVTISARCESWRRATTAILLGIAFQDLVLKKVLWLLPNKNPEGA